MGYRLDFEKMKITATGGIYVRTFPAADKITIDSNISEKPGIFSNAIFVQSLLPNSHTVLVQKTGYFNYSKTLPVQEKEVTKLESVLLIKNSATFSNLASKIDYFSPSQNGQYAITKSATTSYSYFSFSSPKQSKTFSIANQGTTAIKWSDDSSKALISIKNNTSNYYYLFDSSLPKPAALRLAFLDYLAQQISFNPQDSSQIFFIKSKTLYSEKANKNTALIKNVLAYKISNNNILWLSTDGSLNSSDISGKLIDQMTAKNIKLNSLNLYSFSGKTFLQTNGSFSLLDPAAKTLENITPVANDYKIIISPDSKNMVYWSADKIYIYSFETKKIHLLSSGSAINYCQWLNNDYVIFTQGDKIMISEIDYRGNINIVSPLSSANISNMFYNSQDGKIYILANKTLLETEKIIP
jgi:hypothetical protein